ncbi:MAG TPA: calcium/sodium antiporter [Casimicrobiaceae bacterium]|nr:calcium/sodium antiporter [Casimicrobiaceae bacterium]
MHFAWMGLGLVFLVAGAEGLVRGASKLALSLGISPLVVGLTIVAFGTSAPEMAVSVEAARSGQVDIALGNVVGSNIFNVLFILGISAMIAPLVVNAQLIRQEVPVMIAASLLLFALAADGGISRVDGVLFVLMLLAYTTFLVLESRRETRATKKEFAEEFAEPTGAGWDRHWGVQVALVLGGLALLVLGARWLVESSVAIAIALGVSELVVGLTIVAAGTSLPEVATSIVATIRGERDIAVGNVVGSNSFNILGVLGLSATLAPTELPVATSLLLFDVPIMTAVALACLPVFLTGRTIERWEGAVFLAYYAGYTGYLVLAAQRYEGLPVLSDAMAWFVVPLMLVTLVSSLVSDAKARRRA